MKITPTVPFFYFVQELQNGKWEFVEEAKTPLEAKKKLIDFFNIPDKWHAKFVTRLRVIDAWGNCVYTMNDVID